MKRACLLLLPALLLALAVVGCDDESLPTFTRLTITPTCGVVPMEIQGYAIVSGGDESGDPMGGNNLLEVTWNFGDGGTGRTTRDYHTYTVPGEYNVVVTAKDASGNTASTSQMVTVLADSLILEASSSATEGQATTADIIEFGFMAESCDIDYPAVLGDSVKVEILWEMNDPGNHTYTLAEPMFRFDVAGDYTVDLTVTYPAWAVTRKASLDLTVTDAP